MQPAARTTLGATRLRLTRDLGYVATLRGGGVAGSGRICSTGRLCGRGARAHALAGATATSGDGSVLISPGAPTATRGSPQGTPWAAGLWDRLPAVKDGLQTGHVAWSPPVAHVQTCATDPWSASTSPGNPRPAASIATRIPRTT
jgi:hypothetical protein